MKETLPVEKLSDSDRALFSKAVDSVRQAQTTFSFVSAHLSEIYKLDNSCNIDPVTGEIVRQSSLKLENGNGNEAPEENENRTSSHSRASLTGAV